MEAFDDVLSPLFQCETFVIERSYADEEASVNQRGYFSVE